MLLLAGRPAAGAVAMVAAGLLGTVAISFFDINSLYGLALPLWLVAAVAVLATSAARERPDRPAAG